MLDILTISGKIRRIPMHIRLSTFMQTGCLILPWISFFLAAFTLSCSALKLDKNSNCLNKDSACFKADVTTPTLRDSSPQQNAQVSVLPYIDLEFSEELNNPQPQDFQLTSPGNGLVIGSVEKIAAFRYRLHLSLSSVQNGQITLDYSNVKDYNGNKAAGVLVFTGNVDIGITLVTLTEPAPGVPANPGFRPGISTGAVNGGGFTSSVIQFYHDYGLHNANNWDIRISPGPVDCTAGTSIFTGAALQSGEINRISRTVDTTIANAQMASEGTYKLIVCVNNATMNRRGIASLELTRDNTIPSVSFTPLADAYAQPQQLTLACSDRAHYVAYRLSSQTGSAPTAPLDPAFDADGEVTSGSIKYTAPVSIINPTNPTYHSYKFRCIDKAGNRSNIVTADFTIDTSIPAVTVNLDSNYRSFVSSTGYQSTTLNFIANQQAPQTYKVVEGAISCTNLGTGSQLIPETALPASPNTPLPAPLVLNTTSHFTSARAYEMRLCVKNASNQWGFAYLQVTRDDAIPTVTPSVGTNGAHVTLGAVQNVSLTCSGNYDKVIYTVSSAGGSTIPADPPAPGFDANGNIMVGAAQTTAFATPDAQTTKLRYKCISKAGNQSAEGMVTYTIDSILPTVTVQNNTHPYVTGLPGGFSSTDLTFRVSRAGLGYTIKTGDTNCVGGTTLASGTVATANTDISVNLNTTTHFTTPGTYNLRICVPNYANQIGYSTTATSVVRDDTLPPNVTGLTITRTGTGAYTLNWPAVTDGGSGLALYRIYQRIPPAAFAAPTYTSTTNSINITGLNEADVYHFVVRAVDLAGNVSAADSNEVKSRTTLSIAVSGYTAGYGAFSVQQGAETLNFSTAPGGTQAFTTVFTPGATYSVQITAQPGRQNCAFIDNQYGTINGDLTLNVECVSGYFAGDGFATVPQVKATFHLMRGKTTQLSGGFINGHGIVHVNGNIYTTEYDTHRIKQYSIGSATLSNFAGSGAGGSTDANGLSATFNRPNAITTDGVNLYVSQLSNPTIRRIKLNPPYTVTTIAGAGVSGTPCPGENQPTCLDGPAFDAQFAQINDLHYHNGYIYIADFSHHRIRRLNLATGQVETIAGTGAMGGTNGNGNVATFSNPAGLTSIGNFLYVTEHTAHRIRRVSLASPFSVTTVVGTGSPGGVDGPLAIASFKNPDHLASDGTHLYLTDLANGMVRKIDLVRSVVSTIAGNGSAVDAAGVGIAAGFNSPVGITFDGRKLFVMTHNAGGSLFSIADQGLIGYWPMVPGVAVTDYGSDKTTPLPAGDVVDGDLTTTNDRFDVASNASAFNGTTDGVKISPIGFPTGNASRSLCAWVKPTVNQDLHDGIISYGYDGANGSAFGFTMEWDNRLKVWRHNTGDMMVPVPLPVSRWTHLCATHESATNTTSAYVDGRLIAQQNQTLTTASTDLLIGYNNAGAYYFTGGIADVRLYNRPLNESEINELAQDASSQSTVTGASFNVGATGLLSHYRFMPGAPSADLGALNYVIVAGSGASVIGKDGDTNGAYHFLRSSNQNLSTSNVTPTGLANGGEITVAAWVNPASRPAPSEIYTVVGHYANTPNTEGFYLELWNSGGTTQNIYWSPSGGASAYYAPVNLPLNAWTHVAVKQAGTTVTFYINGVPLLPTASTPAALKPTTASVPIYIARRADGHYFDGKIDDVRIYNNALSHLQIRQLATQIPAGLVARFDMIDKPADEKALEVSGRGENGTLSGTQLNDDRYMLPDQSLRFNAATDSIKASDAGLPNGALPRTQCAWIRPSAYPTATYSMIFKYGTGASGRMSGIALKNADTVVHTAYDSSTYDHEVGYAVPLHSWTHICGSYNGTTSQIFINGTSFGTFVPGSAWGTTSDALWIGQPDYDNNQRFTGDIDDVRIYGRILSPQEIRALAGYHPMQVSSYNPTPSLSSLKLHYLPETLTGLGDGDPVSQWNDSSGNGIHLPQSDDAKKPQYARGGINDRPALNFNGDRHIIRDCHNALNSQATTLMGVMNQTNTAGGFRGIMHHGNKLLYFNGGSDTPVSGQNLSFFQTGANIVRTMSQTKFISLGNSAPNMIFATSYTGGGGSVYKNGSDVTASSSGLSSFSCASPVNGFTFGKPTWVSDNFNGLIGDFLYFDAPLSSLSVYGGAYTDREIVQCYLSSKFGIPLMGTPMPVCP